MKTFQRLPFGLRIKFKLLGLDFIASYDLVSSCSLSLALPFTFSSSLSELPTRPSWAMVFHDPLSCQVLFPQPGTHFYFSSLTSSAFLKPQLKPHLLGNFPVCLSWRCPQCLIQVHVTST